MAIPCCAVIVLVACVAIVAAQAPPKPVWPTQFNCAFGLNDNSTSPPIVNGTSNFYYDWTITSQLIDYVDRCIPSVTKDSASYPCRMYFNAQGIYLSQPANNLPCCLLFPKVGPVPPQFLMGFKYQNNETADDMFGESYQCYHWVGAELSDNGFGYWTDASTGFDIQFKDGRSGVYWNFAPFDVTPQDPSIFQLPNGGQGCKKLCPHFLREAASRDPMVRLALKH